MSLYEKLLDEAARTNLIYETPLPETIKGLYSDNVIAINKNISTSTEKTCILAEELGHFHTSYGNILDQSQITNRKQEIIARRWAYQKLVPLEAFVLAYKKRVSGIGEFAEMLG